MKLIPRALLQKLAANLPARDIRHNGRPYLRRFYVGTIFGIRIYLHHFVDSDPDGLHNHPWMYGGSIILAGWYYEERRFCPGCNARSIHCINFVGGDVLHRVVLPSHLNAVVVDLDAGGFHNWRVSFPYLGVWTLFWHTKKVMSWGTLKDKGTFTQYVEEYPSHTQTKGHSDWHKTAPKGKQLFSDLSENGNIAI